MKNPTTQSGKLFKQAQVGAALRERIVSGAYPPGSAIPTRSQLMAEFRVSVVTIQKAVDHLERDGFIQSKWGSGTFVADHPPHLSRYAIAFPSRPDGVQGWTDWWTILRQAAATIARSEPEKKFVTYYEITGHADVEDYQRSSPTPWEQRLAGIIMLSAPAPPHAAPGRLPGSWVYIGGDLSRWNIPGVTTDLDSFLDRALGYAAKQARRRPVLLGPGMHTELTWEAWSGACRRYAMEPARRQLLSLPLYPHEAPRHLTQTLMLLPPHLRPLTRSSSATIICGRGDGRAVDVRPARGSVADGHRPRELPQAAAGPDARDVPRL